MDLVLGVATFGLPLWFALLDRGAFPRLRWIREGEATPIWGHMVVVVGITLAVMVALAAPFSQFHPTH